MSKQTIFTAFLGLFLFLAQTMEAQKVIAVLDFNNTSGDTSIDYLKSGIPESMLTYLANYKEFSIVERSRLQDALKEIQLAQSGVIDESTAAKIGNAVGASAIIIGSYLKVGANIRINARLLDVASGKILMGEQVQGNAEQEIFQLLDDVSERMAKRLLGKETVTTTLTKQQANGKNGKKTSILPVSLMAVGGAGLVTGGVFFGLAEMSYKQYKETTVPADAESLREKTKMYDTTTLIAGGVGGAFLLSGLTIQLISSSKAKKVSMLENSGHRLSYGWSPNTATLSLSRKF